MNRLYLLCSAFLTAVLFTTGCVAPTTATSGNKLDGTRVAQIKKGVTTRSEVIALLGQPENVTMMGEGRRMMLYLYSEMAMSHNASNAAGNPFSFIAPKADQRSGRTQMLQVILNKSDVVEDYEFSDQTTNTDINYKGNKVNTTTAPTEPDKKK